MKIDTKLKKMIKMNSLTKENITSFLTVYLLPILVGLGFSETTSNLVIGLIVFVVLIAAQVLSERYVSTWFTKTDANVGNIEKMNTIINNEDDCA